MGCDDRTSIAKSTPPIGEPKATATPAALAAVKISPILAAGDEYDSSLGISLGGGKRASPCADGRTVTRREALEEAADDVADAAGHVD
jgi:hypothetical protein